MDLRKLTLAAAIVALPLAGQAAVISLDETDSGGTFDLLAADAYEVEFSVNDAINAQRDLDFTFEIDANSAPISGRAASLNLIFDGTVTGLDMLLADSDLSIGAGGFDTTGATVFASEPFTFTDLGSGFTSASLVLTTLFTDPGALSQVLNIGFDSFTGRSLSVSVDVSAVPLPASILLLGGGLAGLGFAGRRRKAVAA